MSASSGSLFIIFEPKVKEVNITEPFLLPTDAHNVKKTQSY